MPGFVITFDPDGLRKRAAELESAMGEPGFWDDQQRAAGMSAEHARATRRLERYDGLVREQGDAAEVVSTLEEIRAQLAWVRDYL